eukprot:5175107-Amphidinium_carterae.1
MGVHCGRSGDGFEAALYLCKEAGLKAAFERIVLREWRPSAARLKALALAYEARSVQRRAYWASPITNPQATEPWPRGSWHCICHKALSSREIDNPIRTEPFALPSTPRDNH